MQGFRALRVHEEHGCVQGRLERIELSDLSPGEVVIRAQYSGINYKDALAVTGAGRIMRRFPLVAGIDVAGRVESSQDPLFAAGDAVLVTGCGLGERRDGGYAEFVRVPAEHVVALPSGLTLDEAMALGTAGFTAALAIQRMEHDGLHPGQGPVVVTGASGGVGSLAVDMLSALGYEVVALTGKPQAVPYLRSLGAAEVLIRGEVSTAERPLESARWAGAVDNLGGDTLGWLTRTVKPAGCIAAVGLASGTELHTTVLPFILRGISLLGTNCDQLRHLQRGALWQRLGADLKPAHLGAVVNRSVTLDSIEAVFDDYVRGAVIGRTLVELAAR